MNGGLFGLPQSRAGWISLAAFAASAAILVFGILRTYLTQSSRFGQVTIGGVVAVCVTAPFYYYFKSRDKIMPPGHDIEMQTLARTGQKPVEAKPAFPELEPKDKNPKN